MDPVQENNIIQQAGNEILAEPERFPVVEITVSGLRWLKVRNFEGINFWELDNLQRKTEKV